MAAPLPFVSPQLPGPSLPGFGYLLCALSSMFLLVQLRFGG